MLTQTQSNAAAPVSYWPCAADIPTLHLYVYMMRGIRAPSQLRRGHPAVWSRAMLVSYVVGVLQPLACEITSMTLGVVFLTAEAAVTVEVGRMSLVKYRLVRVERG